MKAIVTGGCGFIGFNLCEYLSQDTECTWDIIVIDDLSTGDQNNVVHSGKFQYIFEPISQQLCDYVLKQHRPEIIFHLAAIPRVSYSVEYPFDTFAANTVAAMSLLEAVRKSGIHLRIINSSSSSVYGTSYSLPTQETCSCSPLSPYALEKYEIERWMKMYADLYDMDIVSLRYYNVFGAGSKFGGAYSTVLSAWMYHLLVNSNVTPFLEGDGKQSRDFCFIDNVIQANLLCAKSVHGGFRGQSYNIAHGESHTLLECKNILETICDKELKLENRPERIGDIKHTLADISAAKRDLQYNPEVAFKSQVAKMCDWYMHYYNRN